MLYTPPCNLWEWECVIPKLNSGASYRFLLILDPRSRQNKAIDSASLIGLEKPKHQELHLKVRVRASLFIIIMYYGWGLGWSLPKNYYLPWTISHSAIFFTFLPKNVFPVQLLLQQLASFSKLYLTCLTHSNSIDFRESNSFKK